MTSFAQSTAAGDATTAVLALLAFIALRKRHRHARVLSWAVTLVGSADLAITLVQAILVQAAVYLEAQWYVPALGVPLMIVAHVNALRLLVKE